MGFYGNIANTARTQFQFDKIYASRVEMDQKASSDKIYAGRYVLVNYDNQDNFDYYLHAFKTIQTISSGGEPQQVIYLGASKNEEEVLRFKWVATEEEAQDTDTVYEGQIVIVPPDGYHNIANPTSNRAEWWFVHEYEEINDIKYALFDPYIDPYSASYVADVEAYGTARGYDSTVWQKTYQNGVDKYIMVAELNTIPPILDLEADAPKMVPLTPHFDACSTNIYYKLHWAPNWGLRIKAANPDLEGPVLNKDGTSTPSARTKMSSNINEYRSDQRVHWHNTTYNEKTGETSEYIFAVSSEDETEGLWLTPENITEASLGAAAAIYYNKAGFSPERISYAYDPVELTENTYKKDIYYKKINGKYYLADELHYNSNFDYYKKVEDYIGVEPTGRSGKMYNNHTGTLAASIQEDTQELSIMLPTIGDTIAAVWDLVYGDETVNDGLIRNMDISWESARADLNRRGLRLVNDYNFDGYYTYQTKNVDTIAGAINSVHDLLGMIITSANHDELLENINSLDANRIYYDKDNHTFNRKKLLYTYTEIDNNDLDFYQYDEVTLNANNWVPGMYFKQDGTDYIIDNTIDFNEVTGTHYLRKIKSLSNEYQTIDTSNMEIFDGTIYAYKDYVGADDEDYVFELIEVTAQTYAANTYYIKQNETYVLDSSETFNDSEIYYDRMNRNHVRMSDYVRDPIYNKNKKYYRWDEIQVRELQNLSDAYTKNTFYIKDGQGNYVFDQSETPNTQTMYFSLNTDNLKTLASLGYHGIYVPGKYLYKDSTNNVYRIDNEPIMTSGRVYYLIDTGTGEGINPNLYNKVITYNSITLTINTYIPDVYYINENEGDLESLPSYVLSSDIFDPNARYYQKIETFEKIGDTYYEIDEMTIGQYAKTLIQFHQYEFFKKTLDNEFQAITRLSDIESLTDTNNIYVLRRERHNEGAEDDGTYILHTSDYSLDPPISAMVLQTQFYEPNRFHYLAEDFREIKLTSSTYVANQYYIYENNEYILATESFDSTKHYFADYSDYILDTYLTKHPNRRYFTISSVGSRVTKDFLDTYEYYVQNENGDYVLITDNSNLPIQIYERQSYYVYDDIAHIYTKGMPWSFDTSYVPASITLATRTQAFGLDPFEDFARNINTMHGMLLKTRAMLEYESEDTRDIRTVKGALNLLGDKIAQFSTWKPGEMLLVDMYGRLHSAPIAGDSWINITIDSNALSPSISLTHTGPVTAGSVAVGPTSAQTPRFGEQFNIPAFSIDLKGHVATSGTTQVTIPNITLTTGTNSTTNSILTELSYSDGTFTKTSIAPISLVLTGYTGATVTGNITASDTIQNAFNKLETRVTNAQSAADAAQGDADTANNAIAAMDLNAVSAGTGYVIGSVSQTNGQLSASTKQLTAADIPDIKSKEFSYTPTGESTDVTFTLQELDERLRALEALQS